MLIWFQVFYNKFSSTGVSKFSWVFGKVIIYLSAPFDFYNGDSFHGLRVQIKSLINCVFFVLQICVCVCVCVCVFVHACVCVFVHAWVFVHVCVSVFEVFIFP